MIYSRQEIDILIEELNKLENVLSAKSTSANATAKAANVTAKAANVTAKPANVTMSKSSENAKLENASTRKNANIPLPNVAGLISQNVKQPRSTEPRSTEL